MVSIGLLRQLSAYLALLSAIAFASIEGTRILPAKRSYDTHHYYAMEVRPSHAHIPASQAAALLGVELVEQVGELAHHYLVRSEKPLEGAESSEGGIVKRRHLPPHEDPVLRRWNQLSQARSNPILAKRQAIDAKQVEAAIAIRSVERQELRYRHKRDRIISPWDTPQLYPQIRDPIPGPEPHPYPDPLPRPPVLPAGKIAKMQELHKISDPIFPEQWHLANEKKAGYDLNVSSVWTQGVTGKGVNVCLIDDGLDMKSPDLESNFVSSIGIRLR